jgi:uncharacterized protein (TIGR00296 family)
VAISFFINPIISPCKHTCKETNQRFSSKMENLEATPEMAYYCFEVLEHELASMKNGVSKKRKGSSLAAPDPYAYNIPDNIECPLFVGWKKTSKDGSEERLRGCKGTHGTLPLHEGLRQYALLSAFDDSRFRPVEEDEVPRLACTVNLLFAFESCKDCFDWEVGPHGVRIDFYDSRNVPRSATFLPSVAVQFGYTRTQTIERLVEKAGCNEPLTKKLVAKIKCIRFQSSEIHIPYEEYLQYKKKV